MFSLAIYQISSTPTTNETLESSLGLEHALVYASSMRDLTPKRSYLPGSLVLGAEDGSDRLNLTSETLE